MPSPLRIGILGAARIAPKAVCDPARVMPQVTLAGIAARNRLKAEEFATANGVRTVFDSYDALIASPDIDLIYNPLPINLHAEWTIKALEAGKHVLCEKPFAMNLDEAKAMLSASETTGKRLIEAFHYRYHPAFQACLDWIAAGDIGDVQSIEADFSVEIRDSHDEIRQLQETGGGAMMDLGCYPLSWTLHVLDEVPAETKASADLTPRGVDERLTAELGFASGVRARLTTCMSKGTTFKAEMTIHGSEGRIVFNNPLAPHVNGTLGLLKAGGSEAVTLPVSPISTYTWQLAAIVHALRTGAALPTEGDHILRQQAALDGIYEAAGLRHLRYL